VGLVVERLQDDDRDVRQAAFDTISRLLDFGLSVGSTFMYTSNTFQGECRKKIVATVQIIVELFTNERWGTRQMALKVIGVLATVCECFRFPFTHVSHAPQAECSAEIGKAVGRVVGLLQDEDNDVREATLVAISQLALVGQSVNPGYAHI
jgi:hypothetical protein